MAVVKSNFIRTLTGLIRLTYFDKFGDIQVKSYAPVSGNFYFIYLNVVTFTGLTSRPTNGLCG